MTNPPCPECGQHAVQTAVRETQLHVHEGTYLCGSCGCLWQTRWFAAPRETA